MNERRTVMIGSALAASVVSVLGLAIFFLLTGMLSLSQPNTIILDLYEELLVLAVMPTVIAASLSSAFFSRVKKFERYGDMLRAIGIVLLSYPVLFVVLSIMIVVWLQFETYLPLHERPGALAEIAKNVLVWSLLAFVVGALPATISEFFVIRFARARRLRACLAGVVS